MSRHQPSRRRPPTRWFAIALVVAAFLCLTAIFFLNGHTSATHRASNDGAVTASATSSTKNHQLANALPRSPQARQPTERVLSYGSIEGQIGLVHEREQEPIGPESFSITPNGEVLVADVVNERIAVFGSDGSYLRSINVAGVRLGDITADDHGRVIVYDQVKGALFHYDQEGTLLNSLDLNPKDIDTRGYFHCSGDAVYFADAAVRDVLVAVVKDGTLQPPETNEARITEGIHGASTRVYAVSLDKGNSFSVRLTGPTGQAVKPIETLLPGVVSARFAGEDKAMGFYVQTEKLEGEKIALEVHAFDASGRPREVTRMPENDYFTWTAKLVDVQPNGTIVQFIPQREQAKLNFFTN